MIKPGVYKGPSNDLAAVINITCLVVVTIQRTDINDFIRGCYDCGYREQHGKDTDEKTNDFIRVNHYQASCLIGGMSFYKYNAYLFFCQ
jgi:hypothetical protein